MAIHEIPECGRRFDLVADDRTRRAVAAALDLRALPRLEAVFEVSRHGRDGLRVAGQVCAQVEQTCVVTLEAVESEVNEPIDLVFVPAAVDVDGASTQKRVAVDDDAPEPLVGGAVDLGTIATEFLMLGLDPYPRKPGVVFEAPAPAGEASTHPFAALAALKKGSADPGR